MVPRFRVNEGSIPMADASAFRIGAMLRWLRAFLLAATGLLTLAGAHAESPSPVDKLRELYRRPAEIPFPASNPYSENKAKLGQTLFFDPILSRSRTRSCASCHNPSLSWTDGLQVALGEKLKRQTFKSPTLLNIAWIEPLGWDGHFHTLESVTFGPITTPSNMNSSEKLVISRLSENPGYVQMFEAAFGKGHITREKIELALATFQRTIVTPDAPFDRWIGGDELAIDSDAKAGFALFNGKANCSSCHSGWLFTDNSFHDIGVARGKDLGRGKLFPSSTALKYAFKTPTLRDVARRAPYMHDGSIGTLRGVIELYDRGGINRPSRSAQIVPLHLTEQEKHQLIAFLETLTSPAKPYAVPSLPR
jgi:cytochrome c peroxidase